MANHKVNQINQKEFTFLMFLSYNSNKLFSEIFQFKLLLPKILHKQPIKQI